MISPDDHTLLVQQLFVRHQGELKGFVFALWPDFAEVEDIMQEVFLTVTRKAPDFSLETNFLAWARSIARYEVFNARRKRGRTQVKAEVLEALEASCPEGWAAEPKLAVLARCMERLAPKAREIMQLRYQHEHGPIEIASLLGRTVSSVSVALAKARIVLRECVERQLKLSESI
jgi:RNA polymerase sigma-70 factor (ECF subfamily)